jgi:hypothetical protein
VQPRCTNNAIGSAPEAGFELGLSEGLELGPSEGLELGPSKGLELGPSEGLKLGPSEGLELGPSEGLELGPLKGLELGLSEGLELGPSEGPELEPSEGLELGPSEVLELGPSEGLELGPSEGLELEPSEGLELGTSEGLKLGPSEGLKLAIQRINRDVLLTKICNDLLPTATVLCKRKYQNNDTCVMCNKRETRDHMLLCEAQSRIKWRRSCMTAIRKQLDKIETESELKEMFCSALAEWLETATVVRDKYPVKYQKAITSQTRIGWRHIFAGKLSQEWLHLQEESTNTTTGKK